MQETEGPTLDRYILNCQYMGIMKEFIFVAKGFKEATKDEEHKKILHDSHILVEQIDVSLNFAKNLLSYMCNKSLTMAQIIVEDITKDMENDRPTTH